MNTYTTKMYIYGKDIYEHLSPSDKIIYVMLNMILIMT